MTRSRFAFAALTVSAAALLSACAGADRGATRVPPGNFDVQAGLRNLLTGARSFTLSGTATDGVSYVLVIKLAPAAAGALAPTNASGNVLTSTVTATAGNGLGSTATTTYYFDPATVAIVGMRISNGTGVACATAVGTTALPSGVPVGASGAWAVSGVLGTCLPGATIVRTDNITWSLESGGGFALLCINSASAAAGTRSDCVEVMGDGVLGQRARVTLTAPVPGDTYRLVTRNY